MGCSLPEYGRTEPGSNIRLHAGHGVLVCGHREGDTAVPGVLVDDLG